MTNFQNNKALVLEYYKALDSATGDDINTVIKGYTSAELVLWLGTPVSEMSYVLPDVSKFWSVSSRTPPLGILA
jgi:hypothetical protein